MKTTIEIADDLFERAQRLARQENTTFRALTEKGLRLVLKDKQTRNTRWQWRPRVVAGQGLSPEFQKAGWEAVREAIYGGRGA